MGLIANIINSQFHWISQHPGTSAAIVGLAVAALAAACRLTR